ncbi:hypothetical protein [Salibacterium halotolerans]|uniref:hypothetical protein n=1 Tax=Salibacterium halotolerans TaxID=1884432 RepID=UPI00147B556A|nr:hypothetical protein [Salibacterium halotolerans]
MNLFGKSAWVLLLLIGTSVLWYVGLSLLPENLGFLLFVFTPFLLGGLITGLVLYGLAVGAF